MREPTFEEAIQELENTVSKLESGNLSLEESLKAFEKGMKIQSYCNRKLDKSTAQMNQILQED
jgi:exodeoxyribonuclease VII small subunit|tara:strand:- start:144 stop:332 length:189 start_codon:yes stop_codon:yes gene_type:complete